MKKSYKILAVALIAGIGMYSCNSASDNNTATGDSLNRTETNAAMNDKDGMPDVSAWPERPGLQ